MQRRSFLLGLVGALAGAAGLRILPAEALPAEMPDAVGPGALDQAEPEPASITDEDLDGLDMAETRYRRRRRRYWRRRRWWRRRGWGRRYRRRRSWSRRSRRAYRRRGSGRSAARPASRRRGWRTPGDLR